MYQSHFGLTKSLFNDGIALDTAVYSSPQYDRLIANFKVALASPSSVIVLTGPAGVGKTTLTSTALRASSTRLAIAWLNGTPTNASELLELVLIEFGIATLRTTRMERLQLWRQFQGEMRATASRLFVVAERTEDLSPEVLRALDSLTSPDAGGNPGANVVLLGQPGLERHLGASALDSLRQRIRVKAQLEPFTEAELTDYLRHQVAGAGGRFDAIFAPGVVTALYRRSGGIARLANNLCETALTLAASQLEKSLSIATLTSAASLLGLEEPAPASAPAEPKPAAVAPKTPETVEPVVRAQPILATPPPPMPPPAMPPPVALRVEVKPAPPPVPAATTPRATVPPPATPTAPSAPVARTAPPPPPAAPAAAPPVAPAPIPAFRATPALEIEIDFDGGATDIRDVAISDFPVLTDAIDAPETPTLAPPRPAPQPTPARPAAAVALTAPAAAVRPAPSAPVAARPPPAAATTAPAAPVKRVETAYTATHPAVPRTAAPAPAPKPAAPAPAVAPPAAPVAAKPTPATAPSAPPKPASSDEDLLRQTQTMRAISAAKSIDDVSDTMAETLFGDAELDLLTAAVASAANWDDDPPAAAKSEANAAPPKPAPPPAPKPATAAKPAAAKSAPASSDDLLDMLGLGPDAPLELIDDSTLPPTGPSHKTAARR